MIATPHVSRSQPRVSEEYLNQRANEIARLIEHEEIGATLQLEEFKKYASLLDDTESVKIEEFLQAQTADNFESYRALIEHYDRLSRRVMVEFNRTWFGEFFVIHRGALIEHIASVARRLREELVHAMIAYYQQQSRA